MYVMEVKNIWLLDGILDRTYSRLPPSTNPQPGARGKPIHIISLTSTVAKQLHTKGKEEYGCLESKVNPSTKVIVSISTSISNVNWLFDISPWSWFLLVRIVVENQGSIEILF